MQALAVAEKGRMLREIIVAAIIVSLYGPCAASLEAQPRPAPPGSGTQQEAADAIQRAYDELGRSALIAQSAPRDVGDLLTRGRDTYQQALSLYQASDFMGARETAMASADIARAAEQLATSGFSESASRQPLPEPPAGPSRANAPAARAYQDLARV